MMTSVEDEEVKTSILVKNSLLDRLALSCEHCFVHILISFLIAS